MQIMNDSTLITAESREGRRLGGDGNFRAEGDPWLSERGERSRCPQISDAQ